MTKYLAKVKKVSILKQHHALCIEHDIVLLNIHSPLDGSAISTDHISSLVLKLDDTKEINIEVGDVLELEAYNSSSGLELPTLISINNKRLASPIFRII